MRIFVWLAGLSLGFLGLLAWQTSQSRILQIESFSEQVQQAAALHKVEVLDLMALAEAFSFPLVDPDVVRASFADLADRFAQSKARLRSPCLAVLDLHGCTDLVNDLVRRGIDELPNVVFADFEGQARPVSEDMALLVSRPEVVHWRRFVSVRERFAARGHGVP